jgi:hypothetical protein
MNWDPVRIDNVYINQASKCDQTQLLDRILPVIHSKLVVAEYNA